MNMRKNHHDQKFEEKRLSALVVLPVYNEEKSLRSGVQTLTAFLQNYDRYEWKIVIADNNSRDRT
ncbi:MAG: glycosyltransferase, partial [Candidatus Hodarchaeales archaeon]